MYYLSASCIYIKLLGKKALNDKSDVVRGAHKATTHLAATLQSASVRPTYTKSKRATLRLVLLPPSCVSHRLLLWTMSNINNFFRFIFCGFFIRVNGNRYNFADKV